jgi:hypothetical protein
MRSHFTLSSRTIEFIPPSTRKTNKGSHFRIGSRAAIACAVSGATAMLTSICSGQIALDGATDPTYAGGWSAGQNGGSGFGAWSFSGTVAPVTGNPNPGAQQTISSSSPIGTAWTLFNLGSAPASSGLSDVGRAITAGGGLQSGQTFETVIENPTAYNFFGGFDILFNNATDNNLAGDNTAAIRVGVFNYGGSNWSVNDSNGGTTSPLSASTTGVAGMKLDLTLTSATTYSITLTPLSNPLDAYTQSGDYAGPINYVNVRLFDGLSAGPNDTANNFEISGMSISPAPEPTSLALIGLGSAGLLFLRRHK